MRLLCKANPTPTPTPKQVRLLCKGADSVMLKLLKSGQQAEVEATERIMEDHSNEGLRCLVVAQKTLEPQACLACSNPNPNAVTLILTLTLPLPLTLTLTLTLTLIM